MKAGIFDGEKIQLSEISKEVASSVSETSKELSDSVSESTQEVAVGKQNSNAIILTT